MPPLPTKAFGRRDTSPGRTFSIIFAVIAFLVVLGCLILVILLPKFRKKPRTLPGGRYPVVPNYPHPFGPPPRFPSHPALLRGFRKKPPAVVRKYDPRVESPFPRSTTQLNASDHPGYTAFRNDGLFTPPPCCFAIGGGRSGPSNPRYILRAAGRVGPDPRQFTTFSAKHECMLPVPEPLVLKPRPAGRPPPLTRQLERFPMSLTLNSSRNRGLIHPIKLFQELEQRNSDTTTETFGTPCPVPQISKHPTGIGLSVKSSKVRSREPATNVSNEPNNDGDRKGVFQGQLQPSRKLQLHATDISHIELKTDSQKPAKLERMGTLTRPKTPVAEIRNRFAQAERNANKEESFSSKQLCTPATNPFTTPGISSTPPTSPGFTTRKTPLPSTPSRPHAASSCMDVPSHAHRRTPSSVTLPSAEKLTALPLGTPSKRPRRATRGSPKESVFKKRSNTRRLKLVSWSKIRPTVEISRRYSSSSLSTIFKPILGTRSRHSQGVSSVYSRDARGLSFLEAMEVPLKGIASPQIEDTRIADLPSGRGGGLTNKQSTTTNYLKTKIDNWDLHIGNFERYLSSSPAVKRSVSDAGPRRAKTQASTAPHVDNSAQVRSIPLIQIGRSSDDVFGIEADGFKSDQATMLMKRMARVAEVSPVMLGKLERGTAPGGGEWI